MKEIQRSHFLPGFLKTRILRAGLTPARDGSIRPFDRFYGLVLSQPHIGSYLRN